MPLKISRCWDVTDAHLKEAIQSRTAMSELLDKMVEVARPEEGAAKILIVLARMARPSCDWIDGELRIEIEGTDKQTVISVTEDLGGGMRERVFPRITLPVPFEEIERGLRLAPRAVEPLAVLRTKDRKTLVLTKTKARATAKPPSFKLAEDCLRKSLPPEVRKKTLAPPKKAPSSSNPNLMSFSIPRAPKTLDFGNLQQPEKRGPPPVPRRPKPKDS